MQFRRDSDSFSLTEIPLTLGLFFVTPYVLVLTQFGGGGIALALRRRQSAQRLLLALALLTMEACIAVLLFNAILGPETEFGARAWLAALLAVFVASLITDLVVFLVLSFSEGGASHRVLGDALRVGAFASFAGISLALCAAALLWSEPTAIWMLLALTAALFLAYRGYASIRRRHESLAVLYESGAAAGDARSLETVLETLLSGACETFSCEFAELVLLPRGRHEESLRSTRRADGTIELLQPDDNKQSLEVHSRIATLQSGLLFAEPIEDERIKRQLRSRGVSDAMVAPLRTGEDVLGTFLVGNRVGDLETFDDDDLKLFETLAEHAHATLDNGRVLDELREQLAEAQHRALHDALTGLPNRTSFLRTARQAVEAAQRDGTGLSVIIMDLDRLKEVNDTLGHQLGDELLMEVAARLETMASEGITVARLGGDGFALLVRGTDDASESVEVAEQIMARLEAPICLPGITIDVEACAGIAVFPDHGTDADALLKGADVAMYTAKDDHATFMVYEPERDPHSAARLALVADLRRAIDDNELALVYQPKLEVRSSKVVGVEALLRWNHPRRGTIGPGNFIPIAERTGLIGPLTNFVLDSALKQCQIWRKDGLELRIAVNVSSSNLMDIEFPGTVRELLEKWSVPGEALEIEITESSLMSNPVRAGAVLEEMRELGVTISIDDFGTGYSSLWFLRELPIDEIKIDRSFVSGLEATQDNLVIVRSTIELGHNLGLNVVAEGVESSRTLNRLGGLGCDFAQGFRLSEPLTAFELRRLLQDAEVGDPSDQPVSITPQARPA